MNRKRRVLTLATSMLVAAVGLVGLTPAPAMAASCYIVCDGVDPSTAVYEDSNGVIRRCGGIRTVYSLTYSGGRVAVELRYSSTCRMVWARQGHAARVRVDGFEPNGSLRVQYWAGGAINYTAAVNDANQTARVCYNLDSSVDWVCGARY